MIATQAERPVPMSLNSLARPNAMPLEARLFRHKTRDGWGVGLWVAEEPTRRVLQFEDGEVRKFKKGFYHLLEPVDEDAVDVDEWSEVAAAGPPVPSDPPVMRWSSQLGVFESLFDGGFAGDAYRHSRRANADGTASRKGQLERGLEAARELLGKERLQGLLDEGRFSDIHESAVTVASRTSLVTSHRDVGPLRLMAVERHQAFAEALVNLLYGDEPYRKRFRRWVDTLAACGLAARWPLATLYPALVFPDEHVVVRRAVTELQIRTLGRSPFRPKRPSPRAYRRARKAMKEIRKRLVEAGEVPADLLDVSVFLYETLRPKGQRTAKELGLP